MVTTNDAPHTGTLNAADGTTWHIREVLPGKDVREPSYPYLASREIGNEHHTEVLGHTDLVDDASTQVIDFANRKRVDKVFLVAVRGDAPEGAELGPNGYPAVASEAAQAPGDTGSVLATGWTGRPTVDNNHLAYIGVDVRRSAQGKGIGTTLLSTLEDLDQSAGRTTLLSWTMHPSVGDDVDAYVPPTGVGRVGKDATAGFALARGYVLEQAERHSQLNLPISPDTVEELRAKALEKAGGYSVHMWEGTTPDHLIERMVDLRRRMSVDAPSAGIAFEEENWSVERIRESDADSKEAGRVVFWSVAEHDESGELVAYTAVDTMPAHPEYAYQQDTLVHGDHRGHRLGMLVKLANIEQVMRACPEVKRVHTWNAGENSYMLAINVAMGFFPASVEGAWQKRI